MQLIGMLDSPYVRRVAIAFHELNLPYEHRPLSVFRDVDEYVKINPLIKAPTCRSASFVYGNAPNARLVRKAVTRRLRLPNHNAFQGLCDA